MNTEGIGVGIMIGALLTVLVAIIAGAIVGPTPYRERACRAELKLAVTARDTLSVVLDDRKCAKYVVVVPAPQESQ